MAFSWNCLMSLSNTIKYNHVCATLHCACYLIRKWTHHAEPPTLYNTAQIRTFECRWGDMVGASARIPVHPSDATQERISSPVDFITLKIGRSIRSTIFPSETQESATLRPAVSRKQKKRRAAASQASEP